ncbi:unnamed protein product [Cyprideis torosa]|uniref:Uncharacterized protein n=1 Tax=Cyprideis torosa TaxID=163714 RepID=A0A7R8ZIM6_9CRUS|nr:unnamed protein product [Cyprideis torosa]CAG0880313.1 unnamed protein product [Cyprideis torosa]
MTSITEHFHHFGQFPGGKLEGCALFRPLRTEGERDVHLSLRWGFGVCRPVPLPCRQDGEGGDDAGGVEQAYQPASTSLPHRGEGFIRRLSFAQADCNLDGWTKITFPAMEKERKESASNSPPATVR